MKDDAKRVTPARTNPTHAVPEIHPVHAPAPLHRPVPHRKDDRITLIE
jgi:hypothetical protein